MNRWQEIWNKRSAQLAGIDRTDKRAMFLELKRIDGYDVVEDGISYESFMKQHEETRAALCLPEKGSVFEVGCGAGASLWLFQQDGYIIDCFPGWQTADDMFFIISMVVRKSAFIFCHMVYLFRNYFSYIVTYMGKWQDKFIGKES